jgi:hypothetical protein
MATNRLQLARIDCVGTEFKEKFAATPHSAFSLEKMPEATLPSDYRGGLMGWFRRRCSIAIRLKATSRLIHPS